MNTSQEIEQIINTTSKGSFIFITDFTSKYDYETARKALQRHCTKNKLIRLSRGIYYLPRIDDKLGILYPAAEEIAEAIAKRDKARIIPTGIYALHKLGLTTQVPMNVVFLTDGSARNIQIGNQKIAFKKTSPKNLSITHNLSNILVQGLRELGEQNIDEDIKSRLKNIINKSGEAELIIKNIINVPFWIQKRVKQIITNDND
jgi:hypothetical protein